MGWLHTLPHTGSHPHTTYTHCPTGSWFYLVVGLTPCTHTHGTTHTHTRTLYARARRTRTHLLHTAPRAAHTLAPGPARSTPRSASRPSRVYLRYRARRAGRDVHAVAAPRTLPPVQLVCRANVAATVLHCRHAHTTPHTHFTAALRPAPCRRTATLHCTRTLRAAPARAPSLPHHTHARTRTAAAAHWVRVWDLYGLPAARLGFAATQLRWLRCGCTHARTAHFTGSAHAHTVWVWAGRALLPPGCYHHAYFLPRTHTAFTTTLPRAFRTQGLGLRARTRTYHTTATHTACARAHTPRVLLPLLQFPGQQLVEEVPTRFTPHRGF